MLNIDYFMFNKLLISAQLNKSTFLHESCSETLMEFHGDMMLQIHQLHPAFFAGFSTEVNFQL